MASPLKTFKITSTYLDNGEWREEIDFKENRHRNVDLAAYPWPGLYSISPDDRWILRIQKTGSGENIAILYAVDSARRVLEVIGLNSAAWSYCDTFSRLKSTMLYHTGADLESVVWEMEDHTVWVTLSGSNSEKSGDGISEKIGYNLEEGTFFRGRE